MHKLLTSCLQNCKQFTVCNNIKSQINTIVSGVPQSSTLGPLLFSLYVNDLPLHTKFHGNLFADDTVLILKNKNHNNLEPLANHEFKIINGWMKYNRLSLNYISKYLFYLCSQTKESCTTKLSTSCWWAQTFKHRLCKIFRIFIDNKLTWKEQVCHVVNKLANAASIISKIRHYVNKKNAS